MHRTITLATSRVQRQPETFGLYCVEQKDTCHLTLVVARPHAVLAIFVPEHAAATTTVVSLLAGAQRPQVLRLRHQQWLLNCPKSV